MTKKILISHPLSSSFLQELESPFEVTCLTTGTNKYEEVISQIADYHGLLAVGHAVDQRLIDEARNLEIVCNYGVGYDNINAEYAKQKGVAVANTPNSTSFPTANLTMGLLLALLRNIVNGDRWIRAESLPDWDDRKILGHSPEGKILGIIGMGRIGRAVAMRARCFGMKICYYNRNRLPVEMEKAHQATYVPLETLLQQSDVVSIHTPLNKTTRHLLGKEQLALMKSSAYLINTARGGVIEEKALIEALQQQQIAGAGLDVFWDEPNVPQALLTLDNVILTPHNGTGTVEARRNMMKEAFSNIVAFLKGEEIAARVA